MEGDGCVVNRHKTWTTLSFLIIQSGRKLQSQRLHRLLSIAEIQESYFTITESFVSLIGDINAVASRGSVRVGDHEIPVRICIRSDMKFFFSCSRSDIGFIKVSMPVLQGRSQKACWE